MKRRKPAGRAVPPVPPVPLTDVLRRRRRRVWGTRLIVVTVLVALALADHSGCLLHRSEWRQYDSQQMVVVDVVDGDTIDVRPPGGGVKTRVRLWGIDTPETAKPWVEKPSEPFADEATALTRRLCEGQTVRLRLEQHRLRGSFGRLLAHVELADGSILNESLLLAGLARFESRFPHSRLRRYELLEQQARHDKVGLWAGGSEQ